VVVQVLFGQRHIFDRHGSDIHFELLKFIDPNPTHEFPQASCQKSEAKSR
jgi:hypothetical protein